MPEASSKPTTHSLSARYSCPSQSNLPNPDLWPLFIFHNFDIHFQQHAAIRRRHLLRQCSPKPSSTSLCSRWFPLPSQVQSSLMGGTRPLRMSSALIKQREYNPSSPISVSLHYHMKLILTMPRNIDEHNKNVALLQICGGIAGSIQKCGGSPTSTTGQSGDAKFTLNPTDSGATINISKGRVSSFGIQS